MMRIRHCLPSLFILFFLFSFFMVAVRTVLPHETEILGNISVTLHIDPDDRPRAQEAAVFNFVVADISNRFNFESCDCRIEVQKEEMMVDSLAVQGSGVSLQWPYTFMSSGSYVITLIAKPHDGASFQPFSQTFSWYVESSFQQGGVVSPTVSEEDTSINFSILYILLAVLLLALGGLVFVKVKGGGTNV